MNPYDKNLELLGKPTERYDGVRALWLKVIIRAMFDWVVYRDSIKRLDKRKADSAYRWLFIKDDDLFGLDNVCAYLDLNPEKVREKAKRMTKADVAKIEHLERSQPNQELDDEEF